MALTLKQVLFRRGALVAAVTAASVGVAIVALQSLQALTGYLAVLPYLDGETFGIGFDRILLGAVPFAIGYFLGLWILAPIAEELRVGHVITRAVLATGVGATVLFIVLAVLALVGAISYTGAVFGQSFPSAGFDGGSAVRGLGGALASAVSGFLGLLPLGVLGGVLLWLWRAGHPPRHPILGLIDM